MKLLRTFPKVAFEFGLASWKWLGIREQTPRFATCFGDIFLESLDGWWFLDTVEGTLELRWNTAVTMYSELESPEGRATYLMDDLVRDARSRGIHLGEEDVYAFNPHPALGGELSVNCLGTMRFELAVNWVGQMHDQVLHSSGEIRLPPMPDDGRRATTGQVTGPWDPGWSDETFDVPFEQYLATGTFATVAGPRHGDDRYQPLPPSPGREQDGSGWAPYAAQGYGAQGHAAQAYGSHGGQTPDHAAPHPVQPWSEPNPPAPPWSGQTTAQPWPELSQATPPPPDAYGTPYDPSYPAAAGQYGTGAADQEPSEPYAQQSWAAYGTDQPGGSQDQHGQGGPAWDSPAWPDPTRGGQTPAVAPGGNQQQTPHTEDPFTAWDDLWGTR